MSECTVSNLLECYDELVSLQVGNAQRIRKIVEPQSQVILAVHGLQPDVGHEVLWVIREVLSGEILLAKPLLSSSSEDLAPLLVQVKQGLGVPIVGVVSDGPSAVFRLGQWPYPQGFLFPLPFGALAFASFGIPPPPRISVHLTVFLLITSN